MPSRAGAARSMMTRTTLHAPPMPRNKSLFCHAFVACMAATLIAACNGDDEPTATLATTAPSTTTTPELTTVATSALDTTGSTGPSTSDVSAPPTTPAQDEEALKAQIAADYERSFREILVMQENPSLDDLQARVDLVAAPGSEVHARLVQRISDLVDRGERVMPSDPDLTRVVVEQVELVGEPPYVRALVTNCETSNRRSVSSIDTTTATADVMSSDTGELISFRTVQPVVLTPNGWLRSDLISTGGVYRGESSCPSE